MMGVYGWMAMSLGFLTFLVIGAVLVWLVIQAATSTNDKDRAMQILAQHYARGEIDDQEYQRRLRTLGPKVPARPGT